MHKTAFRNEIKHAGAHSYINAALEGDIKAAKLYTSTVNSKCVTPNDKFNAVTAALQLMRYKPDRELVKQPVEDCHEPGSIESILVNILNQSLDRKLASTASYATENPRPLYNDETRDFCHEAELGYIYSATFPRQSRNKVYVQTDGSPVFFKKFFPRGVASALSFEQTNFAGIDLPAGTIIDLKEKRSERRLPNVGQMIVCNVNNENVTSAYPLRLSSFALNQKDRYETFGKYDQRGQRLSEFEQKASIEDVKQLLPSAAVLAAKLAVSQSTSDFRYAA